MRAKMVGIFLLAMTLLGSPSAFSHHGWGYYDTGRPLYLTGRITAVTWRNPHPDVTINVVTTERPANWDALPVPAELRRLGFAEVLAKVGAPDRTGAWTLDLAPINRLQQWGLPREPRVGDIITAIAFPSCAEAGVARPALIVLDGVGVRQQSVALPAGCSGSPRG